jgi:hypothetical protein
MSLNKPRLPVEAVEGGEMTKYNFKAFDLLKEEKLTQEELDVLYVIYRAYKSNEWFRTFFFGVLKLTEAAALLPNGEGLDVLARKMRQVAIELRDYKKEKYG